MKIAWYVDDDAEMIQAVSLMMKLLGFEVKPFLTARAAAAELQEFRPHLLILEPNIPEVSGLDLLEYVRRHPELDSLPILVLTSEHTDTKIDQVMTRGADGVVLKPVTLEELKAAIQRVMVN